MRHRISPGLAIVDGPSMLAAIAEFNEKGRTEFLRAYGFARSSKFYLVHGQRLYDTKALVAAAYRHASGKRLRATQFSGGPQTQAVFRRLAQRDTSFQRIFKDTFGELRNLSNEYDRVPRAWTNLCELGFSKWIPLAKFNDLNTGWLPGVYVIADSGRPPHGIPIVDKRVIYIGETVDQDLCARLYQFNRSINGHHGHSGGETISKKGYQSERLWLSIRSFPLGYGVEEDFARSLRSARIRHLERTLLYEYVHTFGAYPAGNRK